MFLSSTELFSDCFLVLTPLQSCRRCERIIFPSNSPSSEFCLLTKIPHLIVLLLNVLLKSKKNICPFPHLHLFPFDQPSWFHPKEEKKKIVNHQECQPCYFPRLYDWIPKYLLPVPFTLSLSTLRFWSLSMFSVPWEFSEEYLLFKFHFLENKINNLYSK